jgi:hypothetical protein
VDAPDLALVARVGISFRELWSGDCLN